LQRELIKNSEEVETGKGKSQRKGVEEKALHTALPTGTHEKGHLNGPNTTRKLGGFGGWNR